MKRYFLLLLTLILLLGGGYSGYNFFKIELKARVAQVLLQYAWHKTLITGEVQRPWKSFDGTPILRLSIPRHEIDQIVLAGSTGQALAFGPAFHKESKLPGAGGTTVLSSHRDSHGVYIKQLQKGDIINLQNRFQEWHSYTIENFYIINVKTDNIFTTRSKELLLIITCYPFDELTSITDFRYIVTASKNLENTVIKS